MSEASIKLIAIMIFSGLLAYIGDQVGYRLGKRRISLFGLRPRQSATLITITFGIIITFLTLVFSMILSEDVRIALTKVEEIKSAIREKEKIYQEIVKEKEHVLEDVDRLNTEIIDKKKEIQKLKDFYSELKRNVIIFEVNEMISFVIIEKKTKYEDVINKFHELFTRTHHKIAEAGIKARPLKTIMEEYDEMIKEKARILENSPDRILLKTVASSNLTLKTMGGNFFDVIAINEVKIIPAGTVIRSPFYIDSKKMDIKSIYAAVDLSIRQVYEFLVKNNAFINSPEFVHPVEIFRISQDVRNTGEKIMLEFVFKDDIYTLGPFNFQVRFVIKDLEKKKDSGKKDEEAL